MHEIEPFYRWRERYVASEDERSPFFGEVYDEFSFSTTLYNYYIHPQWDNFGSPTLFIKIIFVDYDTGFAVIEMMGEWNDAINNDVMFLKRQIIDPLVGHGIRKFVLIGENVLNFHGSDDCYYEEWYEDIKDEDGWIVGLNFREHVVEEIQDNNIHHYLYCNSRYSEFSWRKLTPEALFSVVESKIFQFLA